MLAGLLKAPSRYAPSSNPGAAFERAQTVLNAMREEGYIDDRQLGVALAQPMRPVHDVAGGSGRYVADWVMNLLPKLVGSLADDIVVETTIDLRLQTAADEAIDGGITKEGAAYGVSQGALVALEPGGAIKALVGGRDYAASQYDRAIDARRQPGSAFKPFVFLASLEMGLTPETVRVDGPVSIKGWQPKDYSANYLGPVTLRTALAQSLNSVAAELTSEVGPARVVATAHRLGLTAKLAPNPSIALGTSEVSLLDLTGAYVPFANGGQGVIPYVVKRIRTAGGKLLYERRGSGPGLVLRAPYLGMMNAMLEETVVSGTAKKAAIKGWQVGGKTGTSQDYRDAWFVGFTANLVAGVWFGNDDGTPTRKASGSTMPTTAWNRFMTKALAGVTPVDLPSTYDGAPTNYPGFAGLIASGSPVGRSAADDEPAALDPASDGNRGGGRGAVASGPVPPANIGARSSDAGRGLLDRLFGG